MDFNVKVIEDSISPDGKRLTTITATYPRFIHSEVMTHRDRARNAASSRAIPWPKMRDTIATSPVIPIAWGAEQAGMQAGGEIPGHMHAYAEAIWLEACQSALWYANVLANIGETFGQARIIKSLFDRGHTVSDIALNLNLSEITVLRYHRLFDTRAGDVFAQGSPQDNDHLVKIHKSIPNRITEPWMWITVVMSATEWQNFFRLRCHPDAEVHFQKIAGMMRDALAESEPVKRRDHLPFIQADERDVDLHEQAVRERLAKVSTARCARVSYLTHEGKRDLEADLKLFDRLCQGSGFGHWSPHEHVAIAMNPEYRSGPFIGWMQFRKEFANENLEG